MGLKNCFDLSYLGKPDIATPKFSSQVSNMQVARAFYEAQNFEEALRQAEMYFPAMPTVEGLKFLMVEYLPCHV